MEKINEYTHGLSGANAPSEMSGVLPERDVAMEADELRFMSCVKAKGKVWSTTFQCPEEIGVLPVIRSHDRIISEHYLRIINLLS